MSGKTVELLAEFAALPEEEKRVSAAEVLRRSVPFDSGCLDDEETSQAADDLLALVDADEE